MPGQSSKWMRVNMRTPGILIFGLVMAPCGWVLDLTATVAPNWRTLSNIPNTPSSQFIEQGIWDICIASTVSQSPTCGQQDTAYFGNQIVKAGQGLMVASLLVTLLGLAVAIPGVRCWTNNPNWVLSGFSGLLIFLSGVMAIIPLSWYSYSYTNISTASPQTSVAVGYCIYLGFIGGIFEVVGGFVMLIGFCRCCGGRNRGERRVEDIRARFNQQPAQTRPTYVPRSNRPRSSASSSVPYSRDDMDDDVSFPRAKSPAAGSVNTSYAGKPYDADL
ncbi:claudin-23 [Anabas testudineus]|uniref:Claudin 23a n=1 Tax=Anabas testudineus TaxID=64144 RepID=A0A3Q1KB89_ANATE|nr:claudin-23 [Anabas testudineus]